MNRYKRPLVNLLQHAKDKMARASRLLPAKAKASGKEEDVLLAAHPSFPEKSVQKNAGKNTRVAKAHLAASRRPAASIGGSGAPTKGSKASRARRDARGAPAAAIEEGEGDEEEEDEEDQVEEEDREEGGDCEGKREGEDDDEEEEDGHDEDGDDGDDDTDDDKDGDDEDVDTDDDEDDEEDEDGDEYDSGEDEEEEEKEGEDAEASDGEVSGRARGGGKALLSSASQSFSGTRKRKRTRDGADDEEGSSEASAGSESEAASSANAPASTMDADVPSFAALGVPLALIRTAASLHIHRPSPIQVLALPHALRGKNVCGLAPTGSGKTLGYCWPLLQRIGRGDGHAFMGLVLLPARELAIQVLDQFRIYGVQLGVRVCLLLGGRDLVEEGKLLNQCPHIVVATPGRLSDHVQNDPERMKKRLSAVDVLVLDEADRLLSDEFEDDLKTILACVPTSSQGRQTLLFSATVSPALLALQRRFGDDAMPLVDAHPSKQPAIPNLSHFYLFVPARMQPVYLLYLLEHTPPFSSDRGIIFAGSVRQTQQLCTALEILKQSATPLHSLMEQRKRVACLEKFRSETARLLVCTDVAGRGLDLPRVEFVINMQVPGKAQDYVHRTGRTARAGRKGVALTFVEPKSVRAVHRIEALINTRLQELSSINEHNVLKELSSYSKVIQKSLLFLNEVGFDEKADQHEEYTKAFKEERRKRRARKAEVANAVPA
ncbi:DEAD/DEAH box helicase domain-containing protein [Besnoitia besnoiti]|uniref:DEAD/DEAH box helicase domain-containing protein n=1 Tax=Besnoitia besnoiti TaxID=94643 RepID=A0A2A9M5S3_BESBE|nr:DEAD/DEAH box helicase domain-containing protein [Besnoitia besnoiti]PFH31661.1 DEAD/DEAH box helicase domain-containing protein [Besnoitia besnoiti]